MSQIQATLDHLFRRESGKIVAHLTRFLGSDRLDLAENVVQEALLKAVQSWPLQGIPDNPSAWILRVAKNGAIDHIRNQKNISFDSDLIDALESDQSVSTEASFLFENEIKDDQLKLMFICCHPNLSRESRIALTLKTLCGFSIGEIAKAFLAKEETIAQRIVRAKQKISEDKLPFEVPSIADIETRLDSVLEVLYLLFNEGYSATEGQDLIRRDLCEEAIFRTNALLSNAICNVPKVHALLALMYFQNSRFNSRLDAEGELLLLEEQDRNLWDREQIVLGLRHLDMSAEGDDLSEYHLQAGIASCHALADSFETTNWQTILNYYDIFLIKNDSPIVALNRAVAIAMVRGSAQGLAEVQKINHPLLKSYYLFPATKAELNRRHGNFKDAKVYYEQALKLVGTEPEKRLIMKRINMCAEAESRLAH